MVLERVHIPNVLGIVLHQVTTPRMVPAEQRPGLFLVMITSKCLSESKKSGFCPYS